jgi:hypothetical protein
MRNLKALITENRNVFEVIFHKRLHFRTSLASLKGDALSAPYDLLIGLFPYYRHIILRTLNDPKY